MLNYKYIIGGSPNDYYDACYSDVINCPEVEYFRTPIDGANPVLRFLFNRHFGGKINLFIDLPGKSFWNRYMLKGNQKKTDKVCFLLFSHYLQYVDLGFISHLRRTYPNCKIVMFFQDLVRKSKYECPERIKEQFDLVLSFDQDDCKNYGFEYYPLVYSAVSVQDDPDLKESDIYFVGKAKDRFSDIIRVFTKCYNAGLRCDFNIVGVPEEQQVYKDKINYCSQMPYKQNLCHIKKTRCMLEIMQGGGSGYTLRYCEMIAMGKPMITNNQQIVNAEFFNPRYISVFTEDTNFDIEFVKNAMEHVDYGYLEKLSPIKLLEFIDAKL